MKKPRKSPLYERALIWGALVICTLAIAVWTTRPDGRLHVVLFALPGDALLIQTGDGRHILIDGGEQPDELAMAVAARMPFWKRWLDAMIMTQPDKTRLPGQIGVLERLSVALALVGEEPQAAPYGPLWQARIHDYAPEVRVVQDGDRIRLGADTTLLIHRSTAGVIWEITNGQTRAIIDLQGILERSSELIASSDQSTVLILPWTQKFSEPTRETLHPALIAFSAGDENDTGVQQSFRERSAGQIRLLHPTLNGDIDLSSDGKAWMVQTER